MPRSYQGTYGNNFGLDDPKRGKASLDTPFLNIVRSADPDWEKDRRREVECRVSNDRVFLVDPSKRFPYDLT